MSKPLPTEYTLPQVSLIAAMTSDHVIGSDAGLPWALPEDLQLFKSLTLGNTVIMGRKTFASIGKPLPGRQNIVLSKREDMLAGVQICPSLIEGLAAATKYGKPVFVIGGAEIYEKALPIATEMHISWIKDKYQGNVYFPDFELDDWFIVREQPFSGFTYIHYNRKSLQTKKPSY